MKHGRQKAALCARSWTSARGATAGALHRRTSGDDGADLDLVVVLDDLAVGQEHVAADHHGGAGKDPELGEEAADRTPSRDLDGAPLRMQVHAHGDACVA